MEVALKQRLVGASVIIALAVIFIPMLFDSSGAEKNQTITINIPEEPEDLKQKVINIDTGQLTTGSTDEENQKVKELVDSVDEKPAISSSKSVVTKQETIIDVVDNTQKINNETDSSKEQEKPVEIQLKKNPAKEEKSIKDSIKITEKAKKNTQSAQDLVNIYRVKYGVFSKQKNAEQLKAKIINAGFKAIVEKNQGEELFTVYSKQLSSKDTAQKISDSIQKINLKIGKPSIQTLNKDEADAAEILLDTGWIVQIGSFASKENSLKLRDKIRNKRFTSFVDEIVNSKNEKRYRVRVGPYATRQEAIDEQKSLNASMSLNGLIKPHEKQKVIFK